MSVGHPQRLATATAFIGALPLLGMAMAQTTSTTGTTNTMSTSPSTSSSGGLSSHSNATSGSAAPTGHRITSEADVKQQLQAEGYSDITNVKREGDHYSANAKQNGETVNLRVDASSGMVSKERG